jgi:hypothetical protein
MEWSKGLFNDAFVSGDFGLHHWLNIATNPTMHYLKNQK